MCTLSNGVGVVLANGEKLIVVNNMLIGNDLCIDVICYEGNVNSLNSNLNIHKIYKHLSDKWNQVKHNYIYGLLKNMEESELLFESDKYEIVVVDKSMVFRIGDKTIKCDNRTDAILEYARQVSIVTKELESRNITYQIVETDEVNFKASLFHLGDIEELVDYDPVMFNITVVMKNKI